MHRYLFAALSLIIGCSQPNGERTASRDKATPLVSEGQASEDFPRRIDAQYLLNLVQVHPKVFSGGIPEGDEAFLELQSLGVRTAISVDGMTPDVETARKYGLRYVHLPHGYDGVPEVRVKELAKAVRELKGPIYIHCHHGQHRSPAAASVACVAGGLIHKSKSASILELAGTSTNYRGLYDSARQAIPLEVALLEELALEFRERAEVPPMAEAMVAIGHTHDHLKLIAEAGWQTPPEHPDLDPAHEALLMREHFTELLRTDYVQEESDAFKEFLKDSEEASQALEDALRNCANASLEVVPPKYVQRLSASITANCKACHQRFRDVPLSEK